MIKLKTNFVMFGDAVVEPTGQVRGHSMIHGTAVVSGLVTDQTIKESEESPHYWGLLFRTTDTPPPDTQYRRYINSGDVNF